MDSSGVSFGLAFFAGVASFLSPCVFALVPAYVGYLSGRSVAAGDSQETKSWITVSHGFAFVLGFSIVFIMLGALAASIGALLNDIQNILMWVGGIVVAVFGLHMTGIITIPFLNYDLRPQSSPDRKRGYLSSAMMGVFFSAGWAPCVGPILGAILTLAINGTDVTQGALLLTAYSAGLAIPFLLAASQIGWVTAILQRYGKVMLIAEKTMGVVLIALGIMLFTGRFEAILAPLSSTAFFAFLDEVLVGRLLLLGVIAAALLGLVPGYLARVRGKNFVDWWFLGAGISLVVLVLLYVLGAFNFLMPLLT